MRNRLPGGSHVGEVSWLVYDLSPLGKSSQSVSLCSTSPVPAPDGGGQAEASAGMAQSLREGRRKTHFGCQAQVLLSFTTPAMSVDGYEVGGRWAPQGKATGDSLSIGRNSKTRIAGQLRRGGWALPRPHISCSQSQETALTTHAQKGSLEAKGESCQRMFYPDAFSVKSILAKRCM